MSLSFSLSSSSLGSKGRSNVIVHKGVVVLSHVDNEGFESSILDTDAPFIY